MFKIKVVRFNISEEEKYNIPGSTPYWINLTRNQKIYQKIFLIFIITSMGINLKNYVRLS